MKIHGTAKGGALSTKDFGVAFGGAVCAETDYQNSPVTGDSAGRTIEGVNRPGVGFQINSGHVLVDKKVLRVTVKLDNDSKTPDATVAVRVRKTDGTEVGTFNTMDATEITSATATEFTFGEGDDNGGVAVDMSEDDMITVEYPDTGDAIRISLSRVSPAGGGANYVTNASTEEADNVSYNAWSTWQDDYPPNYYYWFWLECVYCE